MTHQIVASPTWVFAQIRSVAWAVLFSVMLVVVLLTVPFFLTMKFLEWRPTTCLEPGAIVTWQAVGLPFAAIVDAFSECSLLRLYPQGLVEVLPKLRGARSFLRALVKISLGVIVAGFVIDLSLSEGWFPTMTVDWPVHHEARYYLVGTWRDVINVSCWRYNAIGASGMLGLQASLCWFYSVALRGLWFGELPWKTQRMARPRTLGRRIVLALLVLLGSLVAMGLAMPTY